MASDGLIFRFMGKIHPKFQTPFIGTLVAGLFTGLIHSLENFVFLLPWVIGALSCIFELSQLFKMMSIGTLLAYSMVAGCVLILRYDETSEKKSDENRSYSAKEVLSQLYSRKLKNPTRLSSKIATVEVTFYGR